ncbi:unnamed protein product [Calypogeia fissa]
MGSPPLEPLFTNVVLSIVEPLEKMAHVESIDPTDFDMAMLDAYVPTMFTYRLAENSDAVYVQAVSRIKEGLRKVLVPFFPWAGRWVGTPGGMQRQLLCNDKGVPFIEAYVDRNMDSVIGFSVDFQPVKELQGWKFLSMETTTLQQMQPDGLPGVFVQVTRFKCGGLVVAATFSHMLADGKSFLDFMTAWSDLSRTNKTGKILDHNRGAVQPSTPRPLPSSDIANCAKTAEGQMKVYEVNASVIESLKRQVKESAEGAYVSTNDCIYALIWKSVASLPFSSNQGKKICMATAVEGRNRFYDPPVPNLLGNIIASMTPPKISNTELLNMPLSLIASKIREKTNATARESWLSPESQEEFMEIMNSDRVISWAMSSWSAFPMYSINFGFGNPMFVTGMNSVTIRGHCGGVVMVSPPTPGVSSSAACLAITVKDAQQLEALERTPDFLPFFLPKERVESQTAGHCSR